MDWFILPFDTNDSEKRLDVLCKKIFPNTRFGEIMQWIRKKLITINTKKTSHNYKISADDMLYIAYPIVEYICASLTNRLIEKTHFDANQGACIPSDETTNIQEYCAQVFDKEHILFLNKDIIILNKTAGEKIFTPTGSIASILKNSPSRSISFTPAPCHRLDTGTSGILISALTTQGARTVSNLQQSSNIQKCYMALLESPLSDEVGDIVLAHHLYRDKKNKQKTLAFEHSISTHNLSYLGYASLYLIALQPLKLQPFVRKASKSLDDSYVYPVLLMFNNADGGNTSGGKTHQIRVQCESNGTPLFGDVKYGGKAHMHIPTDDNQNAYISFFLHASTYLLRKDTNTLTDTIIPTSIRSPIPKHWFSLIDRTYHNYLLGLEKKLDNFARVWDESNCSSDNMDINAFCISALGGVIG